MTYEQFEARYTLSQCCCFTGHRVIPAAVGEELKLRLRAEIENLINRGTLVFIAGGALGFDTLAAQAVVALKSKYPFIKLVLALPCGSQSESWSGTHRKVYDELLSACDLVHYVSYSYTNDCMRLRNEFMVKHAAYCVCYLRRESGGTAYTVRYARRAEREIITL